MDRRMMSSLDSWPRAGQKETHTRHPSNLHGRRSGVPCFVPEQGGHGRNRTLFVTALVGVLLGLMAISPLPAFAQPEEEDEPEPGFTKGGFEFEGIIDGHRFEIDFAVESDLIPPENGGAGEHELTSAVSFQLVAFVDEENETFIEQENLFTETATSRVLAAINVGEQVATSIFEIVQMNGLTDMNLIDAVVDAVTKQWTSSLGEMLFPAESNQVFNVLVAGICEAAPACNVGDACTAESECIGDPCNTAEGTAGTFQCMESSLECSPTIVN